MKNFIFLILGLIIVVGSIVLFLKSPRVAWQEEGVLRVGNTKVQVEIADNNEERSQGLSGRSALGPESGMLFIFDTPGSYGFWMKDMKFPIDIIWIDENASVVGIEKNVGPETFPNIFNPPTPVKYVLEVPAGFADFHQITVGAVVQ